MVCGSRRLKQRGDESMPANMFDFRAGSCIVGLAQFYEIFSLFDIIVRADAWFGIGKCDDVYRELLGQWGQRDRWLV